MSFITAIILGLAAAPSATPLPGEIKAIADCRGIQDSQARLSCYDAASIRLQEAIASKNLTVLSRSDVRQARKSLFGFSVPRIPFISGDDATEVQEITSKVASVRSSGYNKWQFRLEDGAMWETTEPSVEGYGPNNGDKVTIKRGILSNYFILFPGMRAIRGRRIS